MKIQIGTRIGRRTVIAVAEPKNHKQGHALKRFLCRCDCGSEKVVYEGSLASGKALSCGCLAREICGTRARKHGLWRHPLHDTWAAMKGRCQRPSHHAYASYGGRGITICERWQTIENFVADNEHLAQPGLTLDREDNDGPYSPENCRWVTVKVQRRNTRNTRLITFDGRTQCLQDWAIELGFSFPQLWKRLDSGWSAEKAFTTPINQAKATNRKPT